MSQSAALGGDRVGTENGTEYAHRRDSGTGSRRLAGRGLRGADPRTGKERRVRRTVHGSKRTARDVERKLVLDARAGKVDDPQVTLGEVLAAWLQHAAPDLAATTIYNYRRIIDLRIDPVLGDVKVANGRRRCSTASTCSSATSCRRRRSGTCMP